MGGLVASGDIARVAGARLVRGAVDVILGLMALIGSLAAAFPAFLLDWPSTIVRTILLFVAVSLMASALLHIRLALALRGRRRSGHR